MNASVIAGDILLGLIWLCVASVIAVIILMGRACARIDAQTRNATRHKRAVELAAQANLTWEPEYIIRELA